MMDGYKPSGVSCLEIFGAAFITLILFLMIAGGGGDSTSTETPTGTVGHTRSGVLSGNQVEVLSRNQLNVLSDVQNCYGDGSCQTTVISTTTDAPVIVNGDHSGVGVMRLCVGRDGNGYQTNQPCGEGYTTVQP